MLNVDSDVCLLREVATQVSKVIDTFERSAFNANVWSGRC